MNARSRFIVWVNKVGVLAGTEFEDELLVIVARAANVDDEDANVLDVNICKRVVENVGEVLDNFVVDVVVALPPVVPSAVTGSGTASVTVSLATTFPLVSTDVVCAVALPRLSEDVSRLVGADVTAGYGLKVVVGNLTPPGPKLKGSASLTVVVYAAPGPMT